MFIVSSSDDLVRPDEENPREIVRILLEARLIGNGALVYLKTLWPTLLLLH